jgi:hypothetical protein
MKLMLLINKILLDGAILSVLASCFILVSLAINPRIWLQDYPKEIQESVPPKTEKEKRLSLMFGIPFLAVLAIVPLISTFALKYQNNGQVPFLALFLNSFGVVFIFNLVDWLLLDWLVFCWLTPKFVVIPGTEGMPAYKDYSFHFRGFLIGTVFSGIAGAIIALVVWIF